MKRNRGATRSWREIRGRMVLEMETSSDKTNYDKEKRQENTRQNKQGRISTK